ncbi:MAG: hypothetical protein IVW57_19665, partial [Ktedonobacterales bacterium]|nr:hypothetical protein [Ktedonobacterales bacterium]
MFPRSWRSLAPMLIVVPALLILAGCGAGSAQGGSATPTPSPTPSPTPTATPLPTCATVLPAGGTINLSAAGFAYLYSFPGSTTGTPPTLTASGIGLFTVHQFTACSPATSISGVQTYLNTQLPALPHGWITSSIFPSDGGLMGACS